MEKVKYNIAIQTYMEVFDYLISNDLFIFDSDKDFLKSKIKIGEYGFIKQTQAIRNTWNEQNDTFELVPAIYVLNILTVNIDDILRNSNVPTSPTSDYAYINDTKAKITGKKTYYSSYQKLLQYLKDIKHAQEQEQYSNGKIIDISLLKLKDLVSIFSRLKPLDKRTIECYARLEEELINYTHSLFMIDDNEHSVEDLKKDLYFRGDLDYQLRCASKETYVDWSEFKELITENYEYQLEENKFDMRGAYSPWQKNPYISVLGLDGMTK